MFGTGHGDQAAISAARCDSSSPGTSCARRVSVLGCHDVLVTAHFLQNSGQAVQIAVGEMLRLPQVQNHAGRTRLGGEVVEIPADTRDTG